MTTPIRPIDPAQRSTLGAMVTDQLRDHVIHGRFRPGTILGEVVLAEQFGVSRGPIREALLRLVQEGLLRREPRRGISVPRLAASDIVDVYGAREAIEGAALAVALAGDPASLVADLRAIVAEMRAAEARSDWLAVADLDMAFHRRIVEATESPRLARLYASVLGETLTYFNMIARTPGRERLVTEHHELAEIIATGDVEAYRRALGEHLADSVERLIRQARAQEAAHSDDAGEGGSRRRPRRRERRPAAEAAR
ncbi:MAG: GntR family transcriptional regulator [Chloroflexota bacterium]